MSSTTYTPSRHYSSTASVSSLSVSSQSSRGTARTQQTSQTSGSHGRAWSAYKHWVQLTDSNTYLRAPSPMDTGSEAEDKAKPRATGPQTNKQKRSRHGAPIIHQERRKERPWNDNRTSQPTPPPSQPRHQQEPAATSTTSCSRHPIPSAPSNFAEYFPSNYPLSIYHPPTIDGNSNLAIDVQTRDGPVTLFHLRMYNMKAREFVLRRYCREASREVCRSTRRQKMHAGESQEKAGFRDVAKGIGEMFGGWSGHSRWDGFASKHDNSKHLESSAKEHKRPESRPRLDSGYASSASPGTIEEPPTLRQACYQDSGAGLEGLNVEDLDAVLESLDDERQADEVELYLPKDITKLEFSNYAHLTLRRRTAAKYEFDYWGNAYTWRIIQPTQAACSSWPGNERRHIAATTIGAHGSKAPWPSPTVEFHLYADGRVSRIATIIPDQLSLRSAALESELGGWVPPCKLQILDEDTLMALNGADVCDVIVATGLQALTDDCIRRRWDTAESRAGRIPGFHTLSGIQWPKVDKGKLSPRKLSSAGAGCVGAGMESDQKAEVGRRTSFAFPRRSSTPRSNLPSAPEGKQSGTMRRKSAAGHALAGDANKSPVQRLSGYLGGWAAKHDWSEALARRGSPLRKPNHTTYVQA